jgi:hypothetical protein
MSSSEGGVRARSIREHFEFKKVAAGATLRGPEEILQFFAGLELIEPGVVQVPYWRPDGPEPHDAGKVWILGGVGRKPSSPSAGRL